LPERPGLAIMALVYAGATLGGLAYQFIREH
jgi:hypothetical protein